MASSSSPLTRTYGVYPSFHGPDVRTTFLSHLRKQFNNNGITMFDDQKISRGENFSLSLIQGMRESKISIIVLSKNYASSRWCMDELLEILKCEKDMGQIVMTVFYQVDPFDVRKQTGEFGMAFDKLCARKTEEERRKWSQALDYVGNIAGEHLLNWDNEVDVIEKIARDVSNKLKAASSTNNPIEESEPRCFKGMAFLVVNLLVEIVSAVADQLSSIHKPLFAGISLGMSILSFVLSIIDLTYKIQAHKARFQCKWPIRPWFYYPSPGHNRILGSLIDRILLLCAFCQLIVSAINCYFIEIGQDGPIKVAVMPLCFAIAMVGSKFMEKPTILEDNSSNINVLIDVK